MLGKPLLKSSPETIRWAEYESAIRRLDEECTKLSPEEALKIRHDFASNKAREAKERLKNAIEEAIFYETKSIDALQDMWRPKGVVPKKHLDRLFRSSFRLHQRGQYASQIAQRILRVDWKFNFFGPDRI